MIPKHMNCVEYTRAWEEAGYLYIQMEWCDMSLEEYAKKNQPIPEKELWHIMLDILLVCRLYIYSWWKRQC